jgi:uncharacterized protein YndB with AHSA1/START domain
MKRFLLALLLIFAVFALAVGIGAALPSTQVIERNRTLTHSVDAVFAVLEDIGTYPEWSSFVPDGAETVMDARYGDGASLLWEKEGALGSLEIVQTSAPDLVALFVQSDRTDRQVTFALIESETGGTLMVIREEQSHGGFPFLDRLGGRLRQGRRGQTLDSSLAALDGIIPPEG